MKMSMETLHCIELVQVVIKQFVEFLTSELKSFTPIPELMSGLKNYWNSTPLHSVVCKW